MSKKGEDLIKNIDNGPTFNAKTVFGTSAITGFDQDVSGLKDFINTKESNEKDLVKRIPKEIKILSDEDLTKDYMDKFNTVPVEVPEEIEEKKEEPKYETKDIYSELFAGYKIEEHGEEKITEEFIEEVIQVKTQGEKELDESTKAVEEEVKSLDLLRIKELTSAENYPKFFPNYEEILKLKKEHEDIIIVITGNLFEQFHYNIEPELFICTTFKSSNFFEFKSRGGDEKDIALFYPFLISTSVLFPKIGFEDVFNIPAGTLQKIVDNILINSKYKTSIEVIKL